MIRTFQGIRPTIPKSCFIEDTGIVIGDVVMGEHCSIWFHAVVRGDVHFIRLGNRTNVQDLCMLHVTHDTHPLIIGSDVTVGHSVILHGCTIKDRVLIGMGAIIMDGVVIGEDSVTLFPYTTLFRVGRASCRERVYTSRRRRPCLRQAVPVRCRRPGRDSRSS